MWFWFVFKTATKEGVLFINTTNFYTVTKSKETRKVTLQGKIHKLLLLLQKHPT